MFQNKTVNL